MRPSGSIWVIVVAWVLLVGGYTTASLLLPHGPTLTAFGDISQCLVPLFANAGLLLNAGSSNWRRNAFWMLLALGCTLWIAGQLVWTYVELVLGRPTPNPLASDAIFFLHTVPMIGALALRPHEQEPRRDLRFGQLDFTLLLLWWVYLYMFMVLPWQFVLPSQAAHMENFIELYTLENMVLVVGLGVLCLRTTNGWRKVYGHLFGAAALYTFASQAARAAFAEGKYYTGSFYDVPGVAAFVWFGSAGILAYRLNPAAETPAVQPGGEKNPGAWPARLAMAAVLSMPMLAIWCVLFSTAPEPVRHFRLLVTLLGIILLSFMLYLRQHLVDADRQRLLRESQESIENLKRMQMQFVQAEKLASLGQLAAGAAHEINNPLTAILGYADLLIGDGSTGEKSRSLAEKIREQARRTKQLVTHLLSFARQVPTERTLLDVNSVVTSAIQLRELDLHGRNIHIELQTETLLPGIRGDSNQLLQVFFNIINNAVDAMEAVGGGALIVRTFRSRTNVVVEFSDTGPGVKEPQLVFDPFYTTKPVGKGTGLGLSICYGLVQEHGGQISCVNRPEGGATFRIVLPGVLALFPTRDAAASSTGTRPH